MIKLIVLIGVGFVIATYADGARQSLRKFLDNFFSSTEE